MVSDLDVAAREDIELGSNIGEFGQSVTPEGGPHLDSCKED
jgi:hypothetical protein